MNPLTDRLQRDARQRLASELMKTEDDRDSFGMLDTLIAHTIKETLTAFQGDPLGLYTVVHNKQESKDYMRGASDQFLADQRKIEDILATLTSSPDSK